MKKTNKTFKRFAAITSASLLAACAVAPVAFNAVAADPVKYTITINDSETTGHSYTAYQIFSGSIDDDGILGDIAWGSGLTDAAKSALLGTYADAAALANSIEDESAAIALAKSIMDKKDTYLGTASATDTDGSDGYLLSSLEAGYYLIIDNTTGNALVTRAILEVSKDTSITPKKDLPTHTKEIQHNETEEWGVVGDNQIGDLVNYKITTTMPDPTYIKAFGTDGDKYKYTIHDQMTAGLTFNPDSVVVKIGTVPLVKDTHYTVVTECEHISKDYTGGEFEIQFDMEAILADKTTAGLNDAAIDGATITTEYNCTLNENALVASTAEDDANHNDNTSHLEYSNNPYDYSKTTNTPDITVYDWTFTFDINKYSESIADSNRLEGAGFKFYENNNGSETLMKFKSLGNNVYVVSNAGDAVDEIITDETGHFQIKGLDDTKTYRVEESTTPGGYNTWSGSSFVISNKYAASGAEITSLNSNSDKPLSLDVINEKGTELPGTGGIGTTIFYLGGGAMAAIGGIYLISKRRMRKSEE